MGNSSAILALVSGLGGATLGAIATIYVPLRQLRRQIRETERERSRNLAGEEIVRLTSLRFSGRAWLEVLLRAQQDLQAGQAVDLDRFDEEVREAGGGAAHAGYRVVAPNPTVDDLAGQIFDELEAASWSLRGAIRDANSGGDLDVASIGDSLHEVRQKRTALNVLILERIEEIVRSQPDAVVAASSTSGSIRA